MLVDKHGWCIHDNGNANKTFDGRVVSITPDEEGGFEVHYDNWQEDPLGWIENIEFDDEPTLQELMSSLDESYEFHCIKKSLPWVHGCRGSQCDLPEIQLTAHAWQVANGKWSWGISAASHMFRDKAEWSDLLSVVDVASIVLAANVLAHRKKEAANRE